MLDPRTGIVKIIDLGASRRFVHLSNKERNNRCAVEQQDHYALSHGKPLRRLAPELCEGLGSLTGSPYYMAPEILLQATRYVDVSGRARSVLEDYEFDYPSFLPREQWPMYQIGLSDLRRGWGIRADIWSWACTVQALLLKTVDEDQRPSSSTISPYDFSFSRHRDEMIDPLFEKSPGEDDVPRFHQWCRVLPLLIVRIALEPVPLIAQADGCSPALRSALKASLRHQDLRPTADDIHEALEASRPSSARLSGTRSQTPIHMRSRPTSYEKSPRHSHLGAAASEATASPRSNGSELDGSRYATPPLSQGASSVSTPQQTCETGSKSCLEKSPDRDRRVRFDTSTADSGSVVPESADHLSAEIDVNQGANDPVPQGFELVSPTRPPKLSLAPASELARPATAHATLQTPRTSMSSTRPAHAVPFLAAKTSRSHPSTPTHTVREALYCRPTASPRMTGRDLGREPQGMGSEQASTYSITKGEQGAGAEQSSTLSGFMASPTSMYPPASDGLGISWPLEDLRHLQLNGPMPGHRGVGSAPSSPIVHGRGASLPLLRLDQERGATVRVPLPATLPSTRRPEGQDIGGSPQCTVGETKSARQSSLMATLKEKQVRLKQSSRKLMGKRASGVRGASETTGPEHGHGEGGEALHRHGAVQTRSVTDGHGSEWVMATPDFPSRYASPPASSSPSNARHAEMSSRRTLNRTDDEGSSKPLLRRLLTWGTTL